MSVQRDCRQEHLRLAVPGHQHQSSALCLLHRLSSLAYSPRRTVPANAKTAEKPQNPVEEGLWRRKPHMAWVVTTTLFRSVHWSRFCIDQSRTIHLIQKYLQWFLKGIVGRREPGKASSTSEVGTVKRLHEVVKHLGPSCSHCNAPEKPKHSLQKSWHSQDRSRWAFLFLGLGEYPSQPLWSYQCTDPTPTPLSAVELCPCRLHREYVYANTYICGRFIIKWQCSRRNQRLYTFSTPRNVESLDGRFMTLECHGYWCTWNQSIIDTSEKLPFFFDTS